MYLSVDIGFGNVVKINQGQGSYAMTRQGLGRPRADATNTNNRHMRLAQCSISLQAKQAGKSAKAALGVAGVINAYIGLNFCLKTVHWVS